MSILIRGMEMPTTEEKCKFFQPAPFRAPFCVINGVCNGIDACPLVDVPTPHGRLIDADEAISHPNMAEKNGRKLNPNYDREWFRHCVTYARLIIETSPTIIEEEK